MVAPLPLARGPNEWPGAQRSFTEAVRAGVAAPEESVWVRWWTKAPGRVSGVAGLSGAVLAAVTGLITLRNWVRSGPQGTWVAVWTPNSPSGSHPELVVKVDGAGLPAASGEAQATLLGELARNGALCLIIHGRTVAPIFNPMTPVGLLRKAAGTRP